MIAAKAIRQYFRPKCTLGAFELWDGEKQIFRCFACEDAVCGDGDPATVSYSQRFGRKVWEVCNVPGFAGVRIHAGNTDKDTEGCLLLGERINGCYSGVANSKAAVEKFEAIMKQHSNADAAIDIVKGD